MKKVLGVLGVLMLGAGAMAAPPDDSWGALAQRVVADLDAGRFEQVVARFDDHAKAALPADKLRAIWVGVQAQVGRLKHCSGSEENERDGVHGVVLHCTFERAPLDFQLAFTADRRISSMFFTPGSGEEKYAPPSYARAPVDEVPLRVKGLPGTLTLPKAPGPFPAVVLVHGSGPNDADASIGPNKPFRDLALGLAQHGIASLRYDKRTHAEPGRFTADRRWTVKDETIDDAVAAVEVARAQPKVDPRRVVVLGHSLGGYVAPRIAEAQKQLAAIVILAGSVRPVEDLVVDQAKHLAAEDKALLSQAEAAARAIKDPKLADGAAVDFLGTPMPASYFLDLRHYDAAGMAARLAIPILVLQGGRDYQVTRADYDLWARALTGHKNATLKLYPTLNHFFLSGSGRSMPAEYLQPGHVAGEVIDDVARFVNALPAAAR